MLIQQKAFNTQEQLKLLSFLYQHWFASPTSNSNVDSDQQVFTVLLSWQCCAPQCKSFETRKTARILFVSLLVVHVLCSLLIILVLNLLSVILQFWGSGFGVCVKTLKTEKVWLKGWMIPQNWSFWYHVLLRVSLKSLDLIT